MESRNESYIRYTLRKRLSDWLRSSFNLTSTLVKRSIWELEDIRVLTTIYVLFIEIKIAETSLNHHCILVVRFHLFTFAYFSYFQREPALDLAWKESTFRKSKS